MGFHVDLLSVKMVYYVEHFCIKMHLLSRVFVCKNGLCRIFVNENGLLNRIFEYKSGLSDRK